MADASELPTGSPEPFQRESFGTTDLTGQRVGHFRVVRFLGRGGMASVWLAEQAELGRLVALKFPHRHLADSSRARRRFLVEARAAALLDHPHLATVYDYGIHEGIPYIAMARVEGESLRAKRKNSPVPTGDALRWVADVAAALAHAHGRGVLHRDVTPNNIVVGSDGRASLIDFGLAVLVHEQGTSQSKPLGTVRYVAPEVAEGKRADPRSDLYGLGVVLYECVLGRLPFAGDSDLAYLLASSGSAPADPRAVPPRT